MPLKRQKISKTTINNLYNVYSVCEKINKSIKFSSSLTSRKNAKYFRKDANRHSRSRNWKNKYLTRLTKEKAEKINIGKQLRANSEDGTIQNNFLPFPSFFLSVQLSSHKEVIWTRFRENNSAKKKPFLAWGDLAPTEKLITLITRRTQDSKQHRYIKRKTSIEISRWRKGKTELHYSACLSTDKLVENNR